MSDAHRELARLLAERRAALLRAVAGRGADLDEVARARSAATADDEHDPEGGTLADEWSRIAGLDRAARDELRQIDAAVERMRIGTYGVCESCGEPIPRARLEVRPAAARCVSCASARR